MRVAFDKRDSQISLGKDAFGRGAWCCSAHKCVERAKKKRAFSHALKTRGVDADVAAKLVDWLETN